MWKIYLFRKIPLIAGGVWLFLQRKIIVDGILTVLTQRVFRVIGSRFPRLSFLKSAGGQATH
ncbi:MAG TPA: hypothetical protein VNJ08_14855 [Bacteriovoracaceae bacterium]|nr:hypothetical protein [Bacteriovoracaceae bacterium]